MFLDGRSTKSGAETGQFQPSGARPHLEVSRDERSPKAENGLTEEPQRVLLVEPSQFEGTRLYNDLCASKFEVYVARDLISAMNAFGLFQPSIVLAQLRLTTYGGVELVRRLKADPATRSAPVILYADFATAIDRVQALEAGAVDVLARPFVHDELVARVRAALKAQQSMMMLERRAHRDPLTGLANRGVLEDHLTRQWDGCRRRDTPLSVMIVDLDHFKSVNDTYGHGAGDDVLRGTAGVLAQAVRSSDLVARYGGEEFVVVAPSCSSAEAIDLARRFRARLAERTFPAGTSAIAVTASMGIATYHLTQKSPSDLLSQADEALYKAKRSGRNAVWVYDSAGGISTVAVASGSPNE
jgi:diguanylate cyclase (GGDEF)-like protein